MTNDRSPPDEPSPPAGDAVQADGAAADVVSVEAAAEAVHELRGWRRLLLWPLSLFLRMWSATLRWEYTEGARLILNKHDEPVIFVMWHNRLLLIDGLFRRFRQRPIYALVSASRDGAWAAAFFSVIGMGAVRGSSNRRARTAASALVTALAAGRDIGITPDGPRGPVYAFKPGALIVARRAQAPLLLLGGRVASAWRLRSWDGLYLPKPFSRVTVMGDLVTAGELRDPGMTAQRLQERLKAVNPD